MTTDAPLRTPARLLSRQVSGSTYFFLGLAPPGTRRSSLVFGGRETCNADYHVQRSRYAYHVLEYVAEGAGCVRLGGRSARLSPGAVFAYCPDTRCEIRTDPERPMLKYFLCLQGSGVTRRLAQAGVTPGRVRIMATHAEVRSLFDDLIREGRHPGRFTAALCCSLLDVLLLKLADLATRPVRRGRPAEDLFLRCRSEIDARLEQAVTLEEVAAAVGMQPSSVCRLFRRFQGLSPYQYLLRRKMTLAAEWLVETGGPVKAAARQVGFDDPYHFSRCFKAVHGVAPNHLRHHRRGIRR